MKDLRSKLADAIDLFSPRDGFHESPVPGVYCLKASHPYQIAKCHWRACLSIVAQGRKEIILGHETYRCNRAHYMVNPIDLPVVGRIAFASCQRPFLCLLIVLDPLTLGEIAAQFEGDLSKEAETHPQAMFVGKACNEMLAAAIRLNGLFRTPEDAPCWARW